MFQHEVDHLDGVLMVERLDDDLRKQALRVLRDRSLGLDTTEWRPSWSPPPPGTAGNSRPTLRGGAPAPVASRSMARLVYLGTPEAAVAPLRTLVDAGHDVALVVSRPDKRRGRGATLVPSPVKAAAVELGLPVTDRLDDAVEVGAELGVVVAYGRIVPVAVLERLPMVNLHFSLLPRWRGAAPVERAVLEGDAETGVCLMAVEAGLDTGGVYAEDDTVIDEDESVDELRARLVAIGCRLLEEHLGRGLAGLPVPRDQVGTPSYAEKIRPEELELQWELPASQLRRVVRLGRAWTTFRGKRLRVLRAASGAAPAGTGPEATTADTPPGVRAVPGAPGELDGDLVAAGEGSRLRLVTVQPEGRQPMDAASWLRGARPAPGERLGDEPTRPGRRVRPAPDRPPGGHGRRSAR